MILSDSLQNSKLNRIDIRSDFFTAKEALSAKGDGKVMRAYLKKSLFER